jgi:glutaredoxin-related protein
MNAPKHEFYFSNYCKHSASIMQELNKGGFQSKFVYLIKKSMERNGFLGFVKRGQVFEFE